MYYHKIKAALREKPEPTIIPEYFEPPRFTTQELADIGGCSIGSVRKYISRMREEGFDVHVKEGEYFIPVEDSYRKDFAVEVRPSISATQGGHDIMITHNGSAWSGMTCYSLRELRELHEALGEYIDEVIHEASQNRSA